MGDDHGTTIGRDVHSALILTVEDDSWVNTRRLALVSPLGFLMGKFPMGAAISLREAMPPG